MPPTAPDGVSGLLKRFVNSNNCYYNGYNGGYNSSYCNSSWSRWGRWVLLAVIVIAALTLFFFCSCLSARRRRKRGYQPYRGTGWALGRTPPGHAPAQYNGPQSYNNPTNTSQVPAGGYYGNNTQAPPYNYAPGGANTDYYGGGNVQQPQPAYGGYAPPKGPPPGRE